MHYACTLCTAIMHITLRNSYLVYLNRIGIGDSYVFFNAEFKSVARFLLARHVFEKSQKTFRIRHCFDASVVVLLHNDMGR